MKMPMPILAMSAFVLASMVGCASVNSGIQAMTAKLETHNAKQVAGNATRFPDPALRSTYILDTGRPAPTYACNPCSLSTTSREGDFDYLMIDRKVQPVNDAADLALRNSRSPIESTDVGKLFVNLARSRGNYVAVYGAPVNNAILKGLDIRQFYQDNASYPTNLSSCLVEISPSGAFVSILAVGYQLMQGVIISDFPGSQDVFADERVFLFPASTSRYVQERIAARFTEDYRVR